MSIDRLINKWKSEPSVYQNIVTWEVISGRNAVYSALPPNLHPLLIKALNSLGIDALYSHQLEAWNSLQAHHHVVVVTGTASGKTLCYNLPVVDQLIRNPQATALYMFPTKALSQDQKTILQNLITKCQDNQAIPDSSSRVDMYNIFPAIYDGDTPANNRAFIRQKSRIIISNPDMMHAGIMPHHTRWANFLRNLKFVVIDEIHIYRGVFGSHVANVLRRLKRILDFYRSYPLFILTSATIANPIQLAENLVEEKFKLIDQDGSARGPQHFILYNPPVINKELGLRRSVVSDGIRLVQDFLIEHQQAIVFARSRPTVEIMLSYLKHPRGDNSIKKDVEIRGYRSGYLPKQRRTIEEGLRSGKVRTVVATNALELGIDIGGIDAILMLGFPGTIAATRQQSGRAGRGTAPALAVLIAGADPLDQFLAHHPQYLFSQTPESALINPNNLLILLNHLRCAVFELPFKPGESFGGYSPEKTNEILEFLADAGEVISSKGHYYWSSDQYPAQTVSLRNTSAQSITLQVISEGPEAQPTSIGQIDLASAFWMVHPEAIYLHEAQPYLVTELDLENQLARLIPFEIDYFTEPVKTTDILLISKGEEIESEYIIRGYGDILVTCQVVGYRKIRWYTNENLGFGEVNLPSSKLQTSGYWIALKETLVDMLRVSGYWNNDPNDYGPNWINQKELARKRDGYHCQICGSSEIDKAHDVHHKVPFRSFKSYLEANQIDNLVTLCSSCHKKVEVNVRIRSGLAGLAYIIARLSPLFLMCDIRDIGVHSESQSTFMNNLPIVILYEGFPAGLGFSKHLFMNHAELISQALELVNKCECSDGCPSCVGPGGENGLGCKQETLEILKMMNL
jgi:DEAD/DEAH box helicase domain-containing protein